MFGNAVQFFFQTGLLQPGLNYKFSSFYCPKSPNADYIDKFRPIVMGNFLLKVMMKILANCLTSIASRVISSNQFGFIRGH